MTMRFTMASLLQRLDGFSGLTNPDTIRWRHARDGKFSVGRLYGRNRPHNLGVSLDPEDKYGILIPLPRSNVSHGRHAEEHI